MMIAGRLVLFLAVLLWMSLSSVWAQSPTGHEEAICRNDPNVFFCENWEDRPTGPAPGGFWPTLYKNTGWAASSFTDPTVQTAEHFDGTKAIRMRTPQNQVASAFIDTQFSPARRTVYWRWYVKFSSNYVWSPIATKHNEYETTTGGAEAGIFMFVNNLGIRRPTFAWLFKNGCQTVGNCYFDSSLNGGFAQFNVNQWYCVESRTTMNSSPGSSDGYIQGWINNVQYWEYPNVNVSTIVNNGGAVIGGILLADYWNCDQVENCSQAQYQHPEIYRYMDNLILSTARIGCLGQTMSPSVPTNLNISLGPDPARAGSSPTTTGAPSRATALLSVTILAAVVLTVVKIR